MIAVAQPMADVFCSITSANDFSYAILDFVDRFNEDPNPELLAEEPSLLAESLLDDGVADAWLASTAVFLAKKHQVTIPQWARHNARVLATPWFAAKSPNLKAILLQESPAAFRVRNLFVSANALSRA